MRSSARRTLAFMPRRVSRASGRVPSFARNSGLIDAGKASHNRTISERHRGAAGSPGLGWYAGVPRIASLRLLDDYRTQIKGLDLEEKQVLAQLDALVEQSGSTLGELSGLSTRSVAELLVEVGDPRRFTEGGFARFNASAPLPASTAEGPGEPVRHRYNPGGNRRINRILHMMAVTQLRCEPRAQAIYANARAHGHTKKEARRILKRHLSDVIYRRMTRDLASHSAQPLLAA